MTYLDGDDWRRWDRPEREGHQLLSHGAALLRALTEPVPSGSIVVPGNFVRIFVGYAGSRSDEFRFGGQADSAEALQILLDGFHTQISREVVMSVRGSPDTPIATQYVNSLESWGTFFRKEYSALLDMFYGQSQSRIICERCGHVSERYEPWNVLKVAIPGSTSPGALAPSLAECIADAMKTEKIDEYACDTCAAAEAAILRADGVAAGRDLATLDAELTKRSSKGPAHKEHRISRFPSNLIVSLKRFTNVGQKVRARIPYDPDNITLTEWRAWPTLQASTLTSYRVYATIEHLGSCRGGHYIMRGRDATDGTWRIYDDARVSVSPIGGAAGPDTYILFLERKQ
jgi:ubiquitin C-terminal hydrolase